MIDLQAPVTQLLGIGDKTAAVLGQNGITTIAALLTNYPRTYQSYRVTTCGQATTHERVLLHGTISSPRSHHTGRTSTQLATLTDATGAQLTLRWFNMPYLARSIRPDTTYHVLGQVSEFRGQKQLVSPQLIITQDLPLSDAYLQPVYRAITTLKPGMLRHKMSQILSSLPPLPETLPEPILTKYHLISRDVAIRQIHFPTDLNSLELAIRRLSWEELYELQLDNLRATRLAKKHRATQPLNFDPHQLADFISQLPYLPTNGQLAAIHSITADLTQPTAMHRLLQGDVGSGKTLVAATAAYATFISGRRTLVLAPTTILAEQLFTNLQSLLPSTVSCALYTSSHKSSLQADVVVGTHALLRARDGLAQIGLVIVDEQHRFGVADREALTQLTPTPHLLMMTATPIPRSLAMTLFHYLDITRLQELPSGRLPVHTYLVAESQRDRAYTWMRTELARGNQIFFVTPLIEIAEEEETSPLKSVKALESSLRQHFPRAAIDILHGKLKDQDKTARLQAFRDGHTQILVATSMIEVGIDIPAANIMVIENAERFGLAQLHQLRGRVGRGGEQGHCLLFSSAQSPKSRDRLIFFVGERNGEKLAEYDMQHRGPGELYGTTQSGFFNLKVGNLWDQPMLEETYQAAKLYSR